MIGKKIKIRKVDTTKCLLAIVFISLVFIPLIRMFVNMDANSVRNVMSSPNFGVAIRNSVVSTSIATVITIVLAYVMAMCVERTNIKYKSVFGIIFVLPMLVPSISNGMGLTILLGNNGILTRLFDLKGTIYGMWGIVVGSVLYAFPVAYLMLSDVIRYEDSSPYEAARVLGVPKFRQFTAISFPYLRKPLITVVFSTFTLIVTDYGVPLMVGGKYSTIPVVMYQEVIGQLNFGKGSVYGAVLLIPAVAAFVIDLLNRDKGNAAFVVKKYIPSKGKLRDVFAYVMCGVCGVWTVLPVLSFMLLAVSTDYPNDLTFTLRNIEKTFNLKAGDYLVNSIIIAILVALVGVIVAFLTAYLSARMKSTMSKFLHLSSMTSAAIPGVVLGLAYVLTFKKTPIYGTIIILVMVNLVHFISAPYLMIYNSLSKINENLEAVAQTLAINRMYMLKDIFIPMCKNTIFEMLAYFFVNCMITISAVSFLSNTINKPISLMINQFEAQMQLESAAVVSLLILIANLTIRGLFHWLKQIDKRKKGILL